MIAIEHEKIDIIDWLIKQGVDLLKKDSTGGNTPLHIAATKGDPTACKLIFTSCPESSIAINFKGETPIHLAVRS